MGGAVFVYLPKKDGDFMVISYGLWCCYYIRVWINGEQNSVVSTSSSPRITRVDVFPNCLGPHVGLL